MRSGGRSSGGVSERDSRSDQTHGDGAADGPRVRENDFRQRPGKELRDGVIRPFNATREGRRGSISEIPDNWAWR